MPPRQRITQRELARMLGMDRSTVSLALRNSPRIPAATKERVRALCRQFNYRPNAAACRLKSDTARQVSLVLPELFATLTELVVARTIHALAGLLNQRRMQLNIVSCPAEPVTRPDPWDMPPLGDVALVWGDIPPRAIERVVPKQTPCIILDPSHPGHAHSDHTSVGIDNLTAGQTMARHLHGTGASRLLFVNALPGRLQHDRRWEGARKEWLLNHPLASLQYCTVDELSDEALGAFGREPGGAVFCSTDHDAMRTYMRLTSLGLRAPEDTKLAGFDDLPVTGSIGLTSMKFDCEALAASALELVDAVAAGDEDPGDRTIEAPLVVGRTTG